MNDAFYMQRCLELAELAKGYTAPNPMVGSVIVHDNNIIGEGYHQTYGEAHAEVNAIHSVEDKSLLKSSIIYINLEPCAHFGKTPPCSDLIIEYNIPKVVIGCIDSYSEVAGKGIAKMKQAGIEVVTGVLESESLHLNRRFFTFHNQKRPYVILKWAESSDGFMDIERSENQKGVHWISQPETKQLVHKWRHEEAGIAIGANTYLTDKPQLNVREIEGLSPTRIVIGNISDSKLTFEYNLGADKMLSTTDILDEIYSKNIQSILIEGGSNLLNQFIKDNIWDEVRIIKGVSKISNGLKAPHINSTPSETYYFGQDLIQIHFNA